MERQLAVSVNEVSKCFEIYKQPQDRLKQTLFRGYKQFYKEFWALKDISLEVYKGEVFGIVGRNGSGKSTLLQIIAGTLSPSSGSVKTNGRVAALLELGSGFNYDFTGRENIYLNGTILGLTKKEVDQYFDEIVSFADIGDFIDQPVSTYSSGMVVRLAFAVQAVIPKDILIVDEALAVGDELFQKKCFNKILEFKEQGGTILFVSHSGGTVIELCDRALLLDAGEPLLIGKSKKVVNTYQRLMYAPREKRNELRQDILNSSTEDSTYVDKVAAGSKKDVDSSSYYDPHLVPKETIRYERNGAMISDVRIVNTEDQVVNILAPDETYFYKYKVLFEENVQNVSFGMLIKTSTNFDLGGYRTSKPNQGEEFAKGDTCEVSFAFKPKLNSGIYFMNAGVLGQRNGEEVYFDRIIDAAAFKIIEKRDYVTAIFDFDINANHILLSERS